jgi:hypothetical protein
MRSVLNNNFFYRYGCIFNLDGFAKSPQIVMPDLIWHPERVDITGFRLSPE